MPVETFATPWLWAGFIGFVLVMLAVDLGVFHREAHEVSSREAAAWTTVWITLALAFNLGILAFVGQRPALEFLTGYLIEKSLSVDNIMVFVLIFSGLQTPPRFQHRVLFWGILGALVMRAAMITAGTLLLAKFHWVLYVFGAFLVFTGGKMLFERGAPVHPEESPAFQWIAARLPATPRYHGHHFFVREGRRWLATPLFLALILVEATDVIFAVDSIPAIFAVTRDPFIVFTSNIFAILGLRSLYFLLAGVVLRFRHLKVGLALVLVFVGAKMVAEPWVKVPVGVSLGVVALLLGAAIGLSVLQARMQERGR